MKRFVMILAAIAVVPAPVWADSDEKPRHHWNHHHQQSEAEIDNAIYDLTIPWPFRSRGPDSDGDGVVDARDLCPDTPRGTPTDSNGCPDTRAIFLDTGRITLYDVEFDFEKATLRSGSYRTLDEIGAIIEEWDELRVEVAGHTDASGESDFNQDLSERRAKTVRMYLLEKFDIESEQLVAVGYGEEKPVATNDTAEGRAKNRRVVFKVLNQGALKRTNR